MKTINTKRSLAGSFKLVLPLFLILFAQTGVDAQAPPNSDFCATDGQFCWFGGEREVIYGANGIFVRKIIKGGSKCLPATFGIADPVPNVLKSCYVVNNPVAAGTDLSGPWVMYNDKAAAFDKHAVITQTGLNLSIDNGYGTKSTAGLGGGRTFTTSDGFTGTVVPDGTRIGWNNKFFWVKQSTLGPPPDLNYSWMIFNEKQQPNGKIGKITQDGLNLSVDIGNGTTSNAVIVGSGFKTPDALTGIPSGDGMNINWSNGFRWFRLHANPKPEVILDISGKWNSYDHDGLLTKSTHTITQTGKSLSIVERTTLGTSTRYTGTIARGDQFVTESVQGTIMNNATRIEFRHGNRVIGYFLKELPPGERKFPDTYGSKNANRGISAPNNPFEGFNVDEMRCVNLTRGHVTQGYDSNSQPIKDWSDQNLTQLCRGSVAPIKTVECYIGAFEKNSRSHSQGIAQCRTGSFTPPKPAFGEDADVFNNTPKAQTSEEVEILLRDTKPLGERDYHVVLLWISRQVAAERLPFCWTQVTARGADVSRESDGSCPSGYVRQTGQFARCSKACPADFSGREDAFTCYQTCPSNRPFTCSLFGCAKDRESCNSAVRDQLTAVGQLTFNIVTAGIGKIGTAGIVTTKGAKLKKAADGLQAIIENAQRVNTAVTTIRAELELYEKLVASDFDLITSPEISAEIDKKFGRIAAYYIKRKYAQVHISLLHTENVQATFKNIMTLAGIFEPFGIADLANAFYHPVCDKNFPFPEDITRLYNR